MPYNYKIKVVNPDKNIISLQPTSGTYLKACAPSLVFFGVLWAWGTVLQRREKKAEIEQLNVQFNLDSPEK